MAQTCSKVSIGLWRAEELASRPSRNRQEPRCQVSRDPQEAAEWLVEGRVRCKQPLPTMLRVG